MLAKFETNPSGIFFSWRVDLSYRINTLGPLCLWQCLNMGLTQSVTFVKILIQMNVRIYSYQQNYMNEYPYIFILIF